MSISERTSTGTALGGSRQLDRGRRYLDELLEQAAVSLTLHEIEAPVDEHVEDPLRVALDHDVRLLDRPGLCLPVHQGRNLVADSKLEASRRRDRAKHRVDGVLEPAREELVLV